ncbi:MAG: hypothetical protein EZS28_011937 [Streblomastix strix]|uniref:Uncharacterized protein n=1 Tax=Streblomastix strix TaxID=222440 RepID=A0A5J4WC54_9EUKA|nr:MAG: hypothetical protein EZS28_011937 [Streblomastix strix]
MRELDEKTARSAVFPTSFTKSITWVKILEIYCQLIQEVAFQQKGKLAINAYIDNFKEILNVVQREPVRLFGSLPLLLGHMYQVLITNSDLIITAKHIQFLVDLAKERDFCNILYDRREFNYGQSGKRTDSLEKKLRMSAFGIDRLNIPSLQDFFINILAMINNKPFFDQRGQIYQIIQDIIHKWDGTLIDSNLFRFLINFFENSISNLQSTETLAANNLLNGFIELILRHGMNFDSRKAHYSIEQVKQIQSNRKSNVVILWNLQIAFDSILVLHNKVMGFSSQKVTKDNCLRFLNMECLLLIYEPKLSAMTETSSAISSQISGENQTKEDEQFQRWKTKNCQQNEQQLWKKCIDELSNGTFTTKARSISTKMSIEDKFKLDQQTVTFFQLCSETMILHAIYLSNTNTFHNKRNHSQDLTHSPVYHNSEEDNEQSGSNRKRVKYTEENQDDENQLQQDKQATTESIKTHYSEDKILSKVDKSNQVHQTQNNSYSQQLHNMQDFQSQLPGDIVWKMLFTQIDEAFAEKQKGITIEKSLGWLQFFSYMLLAREQFISPQILSRIIHLCCTVLEENIKRGVGAAGITISHQLCVWALYVLHCAISHRDSPILMFLPSLHTNTNSSTWIESNSPNSRGSQYQNNSNDSLFIKTNNNNQNNIWLDVSSLLIKQLHIWTNANFLQRDASIISRTDESSEAVLGLHTITMLMWKNLASDALVEAVGTVLSENGAILRSSQHIMLFAMFCLRSDDPLKALNASKIKSNTKDNNFTFISQLLETLSDIPPEEYHSLSEAHIGIAIVILILRYSRFTSNSSSVTLPQSIIFSLSPPLFNFFSYDTENDQLNTLGDKSFVPNSYSQTIFSHFPTFGKHSGTLRQIQAEQTGINTKYALFQSFKSYLFPSSSFNQLFNSLHIATANSEDSIF